MLTVDVKVNGRVICSAKAVNRGPSPDHEPGWDRYEWMITQDSAWHQADHHAGTLVHYRPAGAWKLLRELFGAISRG